MAINGRPIVTKELVDNSVSSFDIFKEYCQNFEEVDVPFKSEFRKDNNPSCRIGFIKGDLLYTDFGNSEHLRAYDYVMKKYNLGFYEALCKVFNDFNLNNNGITNN